MGGLGLPNFEYYFWAAQLKPMTAWINGSTETRWLNIEKYLCQETLSNLPFIDKTIQEIRMGEWTRATLSIWNMIQTVFNLPKLVSPMSRISMIRNFLPNRLDTGFKKWSDHGLTYLYELFHEGHVKSFELIREEYGVPKTDFFRFLQIRNFLIKHKEFNKITNPNEIDKFWMKVKSNHTLDKIISKLYQVFSCMDSNNTTHIKEKWEAELQQEIPPDNWKEICSEAHSVTCSNSWREFKWKTIIRFFRTPQTTAKINPSAPSHCWRNCGAHLGNYTHIFWSCPKLEKFWQEILQKVSEAMHFDIPKDPRILFLGMTPAGKEGRSQKYLIHILFTAAIKCITLSWLKPNPPTYSLWLQKVRDIHEMEKITYELKLEKSKFIKRWSPIRVLLTSTQ